MAVQFELEGKLIIASDCASTQSLNTSFFGSSHNGKKDKLELQPEEALYLMDVRNAECFSKEKPVSFNALAAKYDSKKFLARYFCYRDWRDRGLIARPIGEAEGNYGRSPVVRYPSADFTCPKVRATGLFFHDDLMSIIDDDEEGQALYNDHWLGQYGTYKSKKHGRLLKLDAYETLFLMKHGGYKTNITQKRLEADAKKRRADFPALYDVYEDLRLRGFVVKTGFKFGTHFRLYFPGASPALDTGEWMHSKHVIHVFPRDARMLISEWARAIRVAHGVKKTFILAIPGVKKEGKAELDFLLYHRNHGAPETPKADKPKYVMLALSEEEEIGGEELARAIGKAKELGLDLLLGICDRETSVTCYRVKRVELPKSRYEYYEIEWAQP
ncbi:tRNA-splicing endonuclease [Candidatus Norongarragalina meridionalis]|nr:tRNA-splicing endonuclease [Candidatus Norongarragalina meridionalis]